jgi:hypothetical protein
MTSVMEDGMLPRAQVNTQRLFWQASTPDLHSEFYLLRLLPPSILLLSMCLSVFAFIFC